MNGRVHEKTEGLNIYMKKMEDYVRSIPDFPEPGIIFRDVTSVLQDADGLHMAIDKMQELLADTDFDVLAGAESRGFIFGMPIAYNLHKPFVLVRKKGKLPCETVEKEYDLEYGKATIEMHKDAIKPGQKDVLVGCRKISGSIRRRSSKDYFLNGVSRLKRKRETERV